MKRVILISAIALLAACGDGNGEASTSTAGGETSVAAESASTDASGDNIAVDNLGDMPPKCIELLGAFLKKIEPTVSVINWEEATLADFEEFTQSFEADSDSFDAETAAAGCNKYSLSGSDQAQFEQMAALAEEAAPGTMGFINFLNALSTSATAGGGTIPADCDGTIAEIEPFLSGAETMQDLTMAEVTRLGQLITGVSSNCTAEEASAFYARDDVTAFVSG